VARPKRSPGKSIDPAKIAGANPAGPLGFVEPSHPTLRERAPSGADWVHEIKHDGYRVQVHVRDGAATVYTRRGYDWTARFHTIASAAAKLPVKQAILDAEVTVQGESGRSDFAALEDDLGRGRSGRFVCYVFDLLYLDGFDLRRSTLLDRKGALYRLLKSAPSSRLVYSEHFAVEGAAIYAEACRLGVEGVVSKRLSSTYRSGRNDQWIKTKCRLSDTFPIVAFVEKLGAKPPRIAALYLGRQDGDELRYAGKAATGFTMQTMQELRRRLDPLIIRNSPLTERVRKPKATWVRPQLLAEIWFRAVTDDGRLRHASFKGLREDEMPAASRVRGRKRTATSSTPHIGVPRENILQLLPDAVVPTRDALKAYWQRVGKRALVHLGNRPLKLVRHLHRTTFYHMGRLPPTAPHVHELRIEKRQGGEGVRLWIDSVEGLLGLVDMDVVELHPWAATVDDIEHPDFMVFDLDPGDGVEWEFVVDTALQLREFLRDEGFEIWPKTTGGKGLHLMAPLDRSGDANAVHRLSRRLAQEFARRSPDRYIISAKQDRSGKLFIDYLRNGRGTTAVGAYSPRVRSGFPIAAPITWSQVERGVRADAFTMEAPPRRMPLHNKRGPRRNHAQHREA
jgi:bifunctional non-homologous end joining protein LigD